MRVNLIWLAESSKANWLAASNNQWYGRDLLFGSSVPRLVAAAHDKKNCKLDFRFKNVSPHHPNFSKKFCENIKIKSLRTKPEPFNFIFILKTTV